MRDVLKFFGFLFVLFRKFRNEFPFTILGFVCILQKFRNSALHSAISLISFLGFVCIVQKI